MQEIARRADNNPYLKDVLGLVAQTEELGQKAPNQESYAIFAFDTTGSMHHCIEQVRANLSKIVDNLMKNENINIMFAGVGEYCDHPHTLQIKDFTNNPNILKKNIESIVDTGGGGPCQVSLELFWQELNRKYIIEGRKYVMVVTSDQIAHGQDNSMSEPRADYKKELSRLRPFLSGFYFVSCTSDKTIIKLQKDLLNLSSPYEKHLLLKDMLSLSEILPDLLVTVTKESISPGRGIEYINEQLKLHFGDKKRIKGLKKIKGMLTEGK